MVVIGSGATAVTLVPAIAGEAEHVTMLQRSPSYILSVPSEDRLADALPLVGHVHVADVPGRGEPGSGSLAWRQIVPALRRGYQGPIGLEWWPMRPLDDALDRCRKELEA